MCKSKVAFAYLSGENFTKLFEHLKKNDFQYQILESPATIQFKKINGFNPSYFSNFDKGRIFGNSAELRWRKKKDNFHILLITDTNAVSIPDELQPNLKAIDEEYTKREESYYLWGERSRKWNGKWYQARVPALLEYPLEDSDEPFAKLVTIEYVKDEIVEFCRFKEIQSPSSLSPSESEGMSGKEEQND